MTRVQLSLLAPGGVRIGAVPRIASPEARVQFPYSAPVFCGGVAKTARRLPAKQIIGSAILPAASRVCAGVAQWEERGPRKSVIGVRIAAPAPKFAGLAQWQCRERVPLRRVFDSLDQLQISTAGLAEWLRHRIVAPVTRVRFSHLAPMGGSYNGITHGLQP